MSNLRITGYEITDNPFLLESEHAFTPELRRDIDKYHNMALAGKKADIPKLLAAIEKHPKNPQLKNYLSTLYGNCGDKQKAEEANRWIVAEHPDYLFGKLNLAFEYFKKEEYGQIPKILGQEMELKALYPHRNIFHINEVMSFLKCAVLYFSAIGNLEQADMRLKVMEKVAPDSPDTETAMRHIMLARLKAMPEWLAREQKQRISVKTSSQAKTNRTTPPQFTHSEMDWLYTNGLRMGAEKLDILLALPKESLIADLERVLQDSIDRFTFFSDLVENDSWDEERMNFVIHAIWLLGELKAETSIDTIFRVLSQSYDYLNFYLGDFKTELLWEPIYKITSNNLEACKQFMFKPGIDTNAKSAIADMVEQLVLHQPQRRDEALAWFTDVIHFFIKSKPSDNVIDSDVVGLLICNIIDIKGKELLPEIERLFDVQIVSTGICGKWPDVKEAFERPDKYNKKKEILSISDRYNKVVSSWYAYNDDKRESSNFPEKFLTPPQQPIVTEPKIGRNDPCPCGSEKKYKKCCMKD